MAQDYFPETLDSDEEWIKEEREDGTVIWSLKNPPPPINDEVMPPPDDLIGLSKEELDALSLKAQIDVLRQHRERYLAESDWTQQPDAPISPEKKEEWRLYRQELRDLTNNITTIEEALGYQWPQKPS